MPEPLIPTIDRDPLPETAAGASLACPPAGGGPEREPKAVRPPGARPTGGAGARRGLWAEAAFLAFAAGLLLTLGIELVYNLCALAFFLLRRGALRERMRRIVFHGSSPLLVALGLTLLSFSCAQTPQSLPKGSPGSFKRQVRELAWSARTIADQSDMRRSMEYDLEALKTDPRWKENLAFDIKNLFFMPEARKSLEWDLHALADPDHMRHGLVETFTLWGW